jgi:hypothetical protein
MIVAMMLLLSTVMLAPGDVVQRKQTDARVSATQLFETADRCMACHNGLISPAGEDVSIGTSWRSSMMANSARDPYWQAAVRREILDHPGAREAIENECSRCHMPMAHFQAKAEGRKAEIFSHLPAGSAADPPDLQAADGVSCSSCHQIQANGLGERASFTGHFEIDEDTPFGRRAIFGRYEVDNGRKQVMQSSSEFRPEQASHLSSSEHCAPCHTLYTHALGPDGKVVGELPEQVPYLEWRHSSYRENQSCQSCHLPRVDEPMPITSVLGQPRDGFARHMFQGGNFLIPRVLNRFRGELGVVALPQELEASALRTVQHLQTEAARISIKSARVDYGQLEAEVVLENLAGHKLPTAYPSRRVWIRFVARDADGKVLFESGGFQPDGSIQGNDNDLDASRYEPHHDLITSPDQVQIYETIMVDHRGAVTTGLLAATRYVKDNRVLPDGFDKTTAIADIAVHGEAKDDPNFTSRTDRVRYRFGLNGTSGPLTLEVELWYQPIGFRWARNLAEYDAFETNRFVSYYQSMAESSAVVLARDTRRVGR